jgi:hypothetical protein
MKRTLVVLLFALSCVCPALAERGTVAKRVSGCDYYIVDAPSGYAVLEWYGGYDPDEGDTIIGSFRTYGFHNFFIGSGDTRAYIEEWGLDLDSALEQLSDHCD